MTDNPIDQKIKEFIKLLLEKRIKEIELKTGIEIDKSLVEPYVHFFLLEIFVVAYIIFFFIEVVSGEYYYFYWSFLLFYISFFSLVECIKFYPCCPFLSFLGSFVLLFFLSCVSDRIYFNIKSYFPSKRI